MVKYVLVLLLACASPATAQMVAGYGGSGTTNPVVQTISLTDTQNDVALDSGVTLLRCNNSTALLITGFSAGVNGQRLDVVSIGAGNVSFSPQASSSVAANRLVNFATVGDTPLAAGAGSARYIYDGTIARWRLAGHDQGSWISPAFSAGDFTASGAMTWTVAQADVGNYRYFLSGRTLFISITINTSTVGGTPSLTLNVKIPGGFLPVAQTEALSRVIDNNIMGVGLTLTTASATVINFYKFTIGAGVANWGAATDASYVYGQTFFEVQ